MIEIEYDLTPIGQATSECLQTAAAQLLSYYEPTVTVAQVSAEVPVSVRDGVKVGTSPGHLAAYLAQRGYTSTAYVFDVELFDRSWASMTAAELVVALRRRQKHLPAHTYVSVWGDVLIEGWELFVASGGSFAFRRLGVELLTELLAQGPFIVLLSSTYLNDASRERYVPEDDTYTPDAFEGVSITHAVTCIGYRDDRFLILDPQPPAGQAHRRWIERDDLIAAIMVAQTESDNMLITATPA